MQRERTEKQDLQSGGFNLEIPSCKIVILQNSSRFEIPLFRKTQLNDWNCMVPQTWLENNLSGVFYSKKTGVLACLQTSLVVRSDSWSDQLSDLTTRLDCKQAQAQVCLKYKTLLRLFFTSCLRNRRTISVVNDFSKYTWHWFRTTVSHAFSLLQVQWRKRTSNRTWWSCHISALAMILMTRTKMTFAGMKGKATIITFTNEKTPAWPVVAGACYHF